MLIFSRELEIFWNPGKSSPINQGCSLGLEAFFERAGLVSIPSLRCLSLSIICLICNPAINTLNYYHEILD